MTKKGRYATVLNISLLCYCLASFLAVVVESRLVDNTVWAENNSYKSFWNRTHGLGKDSDPLTANTALWMECNDDTGYPNRVSCAEQGWFIKGYPLFREDLSDNGLIPYGVVTCCKPREVSDIEVKCSARRGIQNCAWMRQNPPTLSSFVSGFSSSMKVDTSFAPAGTAECCDISAVVMGTRRYLNPCNCVATQDVMCPTLGNAEEEGIEFDTR